MRPACALGPVTRPNEPPLPQNVGPLDRSGKYSTVGGGGQQYVDRPERAPAAGRGGGPLSEDGHRADGLSALVVLEVGLGSPTGQGCSPFPLPLPPHHLPPLPCPSSDPLLARARRRRPPRPGTPLASRAVDERFPLPGGGMEGSTSATTSTPTTARALYELGNLLIRTRGLAPTDVADHRNDLLAICAFVDGDGAASQRGEARFQPRADLPRRRVDGCEPCPSDPPRRRRRSAPRSGSRRLPRRLRLSPPAPPRGVRRPARQPAARAMTRSSRALRDHSGQRDSDVPPGHTECYSALPCIQASALTAARSARLDLQQASAPEGRNFQYPRPCSIQIWREHSSKAGRLHGIQQVRRRRMLRLAPSALTRDRSAALPPTLAAAPRVVASCGGT